MTTNRRLSDKDVRAIFECLHDAKPPPPNLKFQVVPVGPNGLKLSPPSFEFENGLYVLLKPDKKRKNSSSVNREDGVVDPPYDRTKVPPHLLEFLIQDLPPETCTWSLSGPQFPTPTAIQQRYCYPKGNPEYCGRKGGALWTMYDVNKREDLEFRLLHVYFSAKRAVNIGITIPDQELKMAEQDAKEMQVKRSPRKAKKAGNTKRGKKKGKVSNSHAELPTRQRYPYQQRQHHDSTSPLSRASHETTLTTASSYRSPICSSPISFESSGTAGSPSKKVRGNHPRDRPGRSIKELNARNSLVSPGAATMVTDPSPDHYRFPAPNSHYYYNPHYPYHGHHPRQQLLMHPQDGPFGRHFHPVPSFDNDMSVASGAGSSSKPYIRQSQHQRSRPVSSTTLPTIHTKPSEDGISKKVGAGEKEDPFPCNMDETFHADEDTLFSDHLYNWTANTSMDYGPSFPFGPVQPHNVENLLHRGLHGPMDTVTFSRRLHTLHQCLRETILTSPLPEQGSMLSTLVSWSRFICKSPLRDLPAGQPSNVCRNKDNKTDHDIKLEDTNMEREVTDTDDAGASKMAV